MGTLALVALSVEVLRASLVLDAGIWGCVGLRWLMLLIANVRVLLLRVEIETAVLWLTGTSAVIVDRDGSYACHFLVCV